MKKAVRLNIYGKVQGVGFRYSALQKAHDLGITGFVKNRSDGSVYIEAEAEPEILEQFIIWCKQGPTWSTIDHIVETDIPLNNYTDFNIK
ncbi:MAG TPA: acylphosphatase [Bacteroidales bacterium]|nr:acylphosphatase [Bacteroidales bacterium]